MLRRRSLAVRSGLWAGVGSIPVGFIVDRQKDSKTYGKFIPYKPHASIQEGLYVRLIELGYNIYRLYGELRQQEHVFPGFEPWVDKEIVSRFGLRKASGGVGYTISSTGLDYMFCNTVNIGMFDREGMCIPNNHTPSIPVDLFWLVYDHLRDVRPDGTSTGRLKLVRYTQKRTPEEIRRPLLKPIANCPSDLVMPLYLTANQLEIMQQLPARSWKSIYHEAQNLKLKRRYMRGIRDEISITFLDLQFLEQSSLQLSDFLIGNRTKWY